MSRAFNIHIADDDPDDRLLWEEAFDSPELAFGFQLSFSKDGKDFIEFLNRRAKNNADLPDLVLLDLNMPNKNGFESLQEVKCHPVYAAIPVIVFTTSNQQIDVDKCYQLGADAFVTKPANFSDITGFVESIDNFLASSEKLETAH